MSRKRNLGRKRRRVKHKYSHIRQSNRVLRKVFHAPLLFAILGIVLGFYRIRKLKYFATMRRLEGVARTRFKFKYLKICTRSTLRLFRWVLMWWLISFSVRWITGLTITWPVVLAWSFFLAQTLQTFDYPRYQN